MLKTLDKAKVTFTLLYFDTGGLDPEGNPHLLLSTPLVMDLLKQDVNHSCMGKALILAMHQIPAVPV